MRSWKPFEGLGTDVEVEPGKCNQNRNCPVNNSKSTHIPRWCGLYYLPMLDDMSTLIATQATH